MTDETLAREIEDLRLPKMPRLKSWHHRAHACLLLSRVSDDPLIRLGYLQLAQYCEQMSAREARGLQVPRTAETDRRTRGIA